ncbi:hypothetical protein ACH4A8_08870 [Streptomyces vietnamensis]|uniref:hypothetical protein n=1 Tax=Streptomyces vietnamensis TaxID=362257 RepID=UPI0037991986
MSASGGMSSATIPNCSMLGGGSAGRVALITAMACVPFLAVLSTTTTTTTTTTTSVTFAAAVSFAHDVFGRSKRARTDTGEVRVLRLTVVVIPTPSAYRPAKADAHGTSAASRSARTASPGSAGSWPAPGRPG